MLHAPPLQINFESAPRAKCVKWKVAVDQQRKVQNGEQNSASGPVHFRLVISSSIVPSNFKFRSRLNLIFWIMIVLRQIWRVWGETVIQNRCSGNNFWIRISRPSAWDRVERRLTLIHLEVRFQVLLMTTHKRKLSLGCQHNNLIANP